MSCPGTLVFNAPINRCEEPENVAECRNNSVSDGEDIAKQVITSTLTPFCVGRKDNIYPLDTCSSNYLQCYNQVDFAKIFMHSRVFPK